MNGKNDGRRGPAQITRIHTNQRRNINKGSKDQTGTSTSAMTKLAIPRKTKPSVFFKDKTLVTGVVNSPLWMSELDPGGRSGEPYLAFENECYRRKFSISYIEHKTNKYASRQLVDIVVERQELLQSTVKRRKLSWLGHS